MLRFAELGFFVAPFALYATWLVMGSRAPRWAAWLAVAVTAGVAATAIVYGLRERAEPGLGFAPAHMEDGRIVPGQAVPNPPPPTIPQ